MSHRPIRSILENRKPVTAQSNFTVSHAARLMREHKIGALIVCKEGRLVGVFTERDALFRVTAEDREAQSTVLADVMTRDPQTIGPDKPLGHALHLMYEGGFRHVPVVEDGRPIGMISTRDALGTELQDFVYELLRLEQAQDVLSG